MAAIGTMVGAAIFLLLGATFTVAGPWTVVSVLLAALVAALGGMAYAELASGRPDASGGAFGWVRAALPPPSGFLSGWLAWSGAVAAAALGALGLGFFVTELLWPGPPYFDASSSEAAVFGVVALAVAAAGHFARIHIPARTIGRWTLAKVLLIVGLLALGLGTAEERSEGVVSIAAGPQFPGLFLGAGIFFIAFQGFEVVAQLSDQAKKPERTVPRGIFLAVGATLGLYLLFVLSILANVPRTSIAGWPSCDACGAPSEDFFFSALSQFALGAPSVRIAFLAVGIVSMYGALNASLTSAVRTSFSMARDGLLPHALARVGGREVPPAAVAASTVGAGVLLLFSLEAIAILASLAFLGLFAFVHASVVSLRRRERRTVPGFRMPLVPVLPMVAVALNLSVGAMLWRYPASGASPIRIPAGDVATYLGAFWVAVGLIYHFFAGGRASLQRRHVPSGSEVSAVLSGEETVELERYRVFLPLREFEDIELVDFGARIARARGGELSLLNVVEIPRNLPPKAIRFRYVDDRIRGLQRLAKIGTRYGVDTRPVVKIGYKVYEIILDTIREEAVNLLVMGWRGERIEGDRRILGSNIDYLIENAPCDVVVFKTKGMTRPLRRIVILTSPIWSLEGIGELALTLAEEDRSMVSVVSFAGSQEEADRLKKDATTFVQRCQDLGFAVESKVLYESRWESRAIQESEEASILMIRATSPEGARKFALSPVEDRIAKLAKSPVLLLRKGVA